MKTILTTLLALSTSISYGAITKIDVYYDVMALQAACKKLECTDRGCQYQIRFDDESFKKVKDSGFKNTRFKKSPREICEKNELPTDGAGFGSVNVLLYNLDLDALNVLL